MCMSPRLWGKVCRPLESTPCPDLNSGEIVATLSISLVVQIFQAFPSLLSGYHF
jgi:hypothetical protein